MKELFTLYYHRRILFTDFFSQSRRLIMSAEDVWNVSLTAPEANILLCAIFSVKKKVFLCAEPSIHSGKDSQLCGEEIFLFSQS